MSERGFHPMFDLKGKKAIVTGAGGGLGKAIAQGIYQAGAEVVLLDISKQIHDTKEEIGTEDTKVFAVQGDLSNREDRRQLFQKSIELLGGRLDILVNAAGIIDKQPAEEYSIESWDKVLEVNLSAVFELSQLAGEMMIKQKSGKIINIASMLSFFGGYHVVSYSASKGGVAQLTKSLSNEWAKHGIQVNAIAPGYMDTKLNNHIKNDPVRFDQITARIPAGKWGSPEDLKGIAVFLASSASNYISGTIIPVDGGYMSR
jgi:2-dehydro-3-deoxy-D-gluconate 5-dehydrogenase